MTAAQLLLQDFDAEMEGTRKTLERVPEGMPDYKPHEKSMAMGKLAMHVAMLPLFGTYILTDPDMDMAQPRHPHPDLTFKSRADMLAQFDKCAGEARAALEKLSDEELAENWRFSFGQQTISNSPRSLAYRHMFFNHLVHHRAQIGVYLRLNGIPVPGLYGPSADEPFKPA